MEKIVKNDVSEIKKPGTSDRSYVQLFEQQACQNPDEKAVCFRDESLTYQQLNRRANQLASFLLKKGVSQGKKIGLYTERSIDSIIGFLAILKLNCVYVPFSLKYPPERLKYIADNAEISFFITQESHKSNIKNIDISTICIDTQWEAISQENDKNHGLSYYPADLAYIIYTSGTTGNPKGVKIKHESLMNFYDSLNEAIFYDSLGQHYNLGFYCALDFDMSFKQLLQLLNGHTMHIIPEEMRMDLKGLKDFIEKNDIHVLDCPTPVIKVLLHLGLLNNKKHSLKKVLFGGEAIDANTWKIMAEDKSLDFYNMYGPTECTIDATITRVNDENETPHIGVSVLNTEVFILDEQMNPVAGNIAGELYVGGKCLAEGYQGDEQLTNEKFIYADIGERKNLRLYKTGDLARYLSNGNIEYLGRIDRQVKIRGYRIEIQEIEAVIRQYDRIKDVIVKVIDKEGSRDIANRILAAYLLPAEGSEIDFNEMKELLKDKLPEFMIPSAFITINEIPLTRNGKTDYSALPAPDWNDIGTEGGKTSEELTLLEKYIIKTWKAILNVEHIGVGDNFFEKGGHSLAAMQITAELEEYFETGIPLISLFFEGPTTKEFATAIEENMENPDRLEQILQEIHNN